LTAAAAATVIQLCFRVQARRIATFAEAFSSIAWAATTALVAAQTWAALGTAAIALGILAGVWLISPSRT
jgi:ABC-2 type transport system permease protein